MNRRLKRLLRASCLLFCAGFGMQASASIVGVDFGPPVSTTPGNWNLVTGTGVVAGLVNEAGDPTAIAISVSGPGINDFNVGLLASTIPTHSTSLANLTGSIFTFEDGVNLVFSGLQPNSRHDVWVFGARDLQGNPGPAFEQAVSISGGTSFIQVGAHEELVVNGQVGAAAVNLSNYAVPGRADATGELTITVTDPGNLNIAGGGVFLTGVALRPALEPNAVPSSTLWSLLLLGGLMTLVARRARASR